MRLPVDDGEDERVADPDGQLVPHRRRAFRVAEEEKSGSP
jgi:hypothetical protein